jgi:hypothetical protein
LRQKRTKGKKRRNSELVTEDTEGEEGMEDGSEEGNHSAVRQSTLMNTDPEVLARRRKGAEGRQSDDR